MLSFFGDHDVIFRKPQTIMIIPQTVIDILRKVRYNLRYKDIN